jgi:cytochrome c
MRIRAPLVGAIALAFSVVATPVTAGDAAAGKTYFGQLCTACHTAEPNDNGGETGPSLIGVFGRPAAADANFPYTQPLKNSKLVWDAATLDRFLNDPEKVVPGTMMAFAVTEKADRDNLISYFQSLAK